MQNLSIRRQKRLEGEDEFADPAASDQESGDDGSRVKEKPKSAATGRGRGSRGGRGRGSRGGGSGRGSRGGLGSSSSSARGGRGSRGKKNAESAATAATSITPSTPGLAAAASPSLTFSSTGSIKSSRHMVCVCVYVYVFYIIIFILSTHSVESKSPHREEIDVLSRL